MRIRANSRPRTAVSHPFHFLWFLVNWEQDSLAVGHLQRVFIAITFRLSLITPTDYWLSDYFLMINCQWSQSYTHLTWTPSLSLSLGVFVLLSKCTLSWCRILILSPRQRLQTQSLVATRDIPVSDSDRDYPCSCKSRLGMGTAKNLPTTHSSFGRFHALFHSLLQETITTIKQTKHTPGMRDD